MEGVEKDKEIVGPTSKAAEEFEYNSGFGSMMSNCTKKTRGMQVTEIDYLNAFMTCSRIVINVECGV